MNNKLLLPIRYYKKRRKHNISNKRLITKYNKMNHTK